MSDTEYLALAIVTAILLPHRRKASAQITDAEHRKSIIAEAKQLLVDVKQS